MPSIELLKIYLINKTHFHFVIYVRSRTFNRRLLRTTLKSGFTASAAIFDLDIKSNRFLPVRIDAILINARLERFAGPKRAIYFENWKMDSKSFRLLFGCISGNGRSASSRAQIIGEPAKMRNRCRNNGAISGQNLKNRCKICTITRRKIQSEGEWRS